MPGDAQGYEGACNEQLICNGVEQGAGTRMPVKSLCEITVEPVRESGNEKQQQRDVVAAVQQQRKNRRNERDAKQGNRVGQPTQGHAGLKIPKWRAVHEVEGIRYRKRLEL